MSPGVDWAAASIYSFGPKIWCPLGDIWRSFLVPRAAFCRPCGCKVFPVGTVLCKGTLLGTCRNCLCLIRRRKAQSWATVEGHLDDLQPRFRAQQRNQLFCSTSSFLAGLPGANYYHAFQAEDGCFLDALPSEKSHLVRSVHPTSQTASDRYSGREYCMALSALRRGETDFASRIRRLKRR